MSERTMRTTSSKPERAGDRPPPYHAVQEENIMKVDNEVIREMIVKYGRLRQLQGQAEGPGDWVREPYDLRVDADELLEEIEEAL